MSSIGSPPIMESMTTPFEVSLALGFLASATNRDEAQTWAQEASRRGATPQDLADAWMRFDHIQADAVQTIHSTPTHPEENPA